MDAPQFEQKKSFWRRPEGITGFLFLIALIAGGGYLITTFWAQIIGFIGTTLGLAAAIAVLGVVAYMVLDKRTRTLFGYMYKSVMRWITGLFVQIDPIGILKSYVEEMGKNLNKLREQIGNIRGQMRHLQMLMEKNDTEIKNQLSLAKVARDKGKEQAM
ncbi:MAG: hypothetical protein AAFU67_17365, partial [Bacteroidota bacterium]